MNNARRNAARKRRNHKRFFVCPTLPDNRGSIALAGLSKHWRLRRHTGLSYWTVGGIIHPMTAWALGRGHLSKRAALDAWRNAMNNDTRLQA